MRRPLTEYSLPRTGQLRTKNRHCRITQTGGRVSSAVLAMIKIVGVLNFNKSKLFVAVAVTLFIE